MSIHLKENVCPMAKKGTPGNVKFVKLSDNTYSYKELRKIVDEILDKAKNDSKTYLESEKIGSYIVQSREYRISIAEVPFSESLEITAVKPVVNIELSDYHLSDKLMDRIRTNAEGILISGSPGAGKSTFVQSIAKFYSEELNKVVKQWNRQEICNYPMKLHNTVPLKEVWRILPMFYFLFVQIILFMMN